MSTIIPSRSISEATRAFVTQLQSRLAEAQQEATTARLADAGKSLGHRTGVLVSLRDDHARLSTIIETNASAKAKLDVTQVALKSMVDGGQQFVSALVASRDSGSGPGI